MTAPESSPSDRSDRWLEALHDAIVSDQDVDIPESVSGTWAEKTPAVRACLRMIERVRRARVSGDPTPVLSNVETLSEPIFTGGQSKIGRFEIIRDLGRGGHGIVFLARDPALDRQVALKVPRPEVLLTPEMRRRFLREAHAAARLSHPHIVSVHEVGDAAPVCYIAADYCPGESLHAYLRSHANLSPRDAAVLTAELASAVQYAHDHGVLHRDLKPSNVLLSRRLATTPGNFDTDFAFEPKLTDFGLARLAEHDADQTRTGALVGTPAYMAPEQAEGRVHDIGPATDVYGLGAVLYEMLTCRPPFQGMTDVDTLRRVLSDDPPRPRLTRRDVPRELEAICLRALEKNPRRRYSSAQAMADDLGNFLGGRPVDAKVATPLERVTKWSRRNPALATVWVLGAVLIGILIWSNLRVSQALEDTREQTALAQANERTARRHAYGTDIRLANEAWLNAQPVEMRQFLEKYIPRPGQEDLRGMEWHYLWNSLNSSSVKLVDQRSPVWSLAVSPDDSMFATGDPEGVVRLWQVNPPQLLHTLRGHERKYVDAVLFADEGKTLFSGGDDGMIFQWDVANGKVLRRWRAHDGWIGALALSHDGVHLASGGSDKRVLIWNAADGSKVNECRQHADAVRWLEFHRNGKWLASAAVGQPAHLEYYRDLTKGTNADNEELEAAPSAITKAYALGSHGVSVWGAGNELVHWDIRKEGRGKITDTWPIDENIKCLLIAQGLLVEGYDHPPVIRVRDPDHNMQQLHELKGHADSVRVLAAAERGTFLSGSEDGTIRKWWLDGGHQVRRHIRLRSSPYLVSWSPNGQLLVVFLKDGSQWIRAGSGDPVVTSANESAPRIRAANVTNGGRLVTMDDAGNVRWSKPGDPLAEISFQLSPDADRCALDEHRNLLACENDKLLQVVDARTGKVRWTVMHPEAIRQIAFLTNGRVITACRDGIVRAFESGSGRLLDQSAAHRREIYHWDISPDESQLLTTSDDHTIRRIDLATMDELNHYSFADSGTIACLVSDQRRLLTCFDAGLNILDAESGQTLIVVPHPNQLGGQVMSPDGHTLAVPNDGSLYLYRCD